MKEKTNEIILNTAIDLFRQNGYSAVTINEICNMCGITKGTFYYHFKTKEDLVLSYYEMLSDDMMQIMPELLKDKPCIEKVWSCIEYFIDNTISLGPDLLKNLIQIDMNAGCNVFSPYWKDHSPAEKIFSKMELELIRQGQKSGEIRDNISAEDLLWNFYAGLMGVAMHWSSVNGKYDEKKELKKLFDQIFMKE